MGRVETDVDKGMGRDIDIERWTEINMDINMDRTAERCGRKGKQAGKDVYPVKEECIPHSSRQSATAIHTWKHLILSNFRS